MFRVIIAGGRDFDDYELLRSRMDDLLNYKKDGITVVCGEARGADSLGRRYAEERGYQIASFPADWSKYHKQAGYIRNVEMANNADALAAFWDGKSRGTKHMIETARKFGLQVKIIHYEPRQ